MVWSFVILAYICVGLLAGLLGGLLGIGGGVVTVPCLYLLFGLLHFPKEHLMHLAIGTSLAAMVFNTLASTYAHHKRGGVVWDIFKRMAPGLLLGSILGALVAGVLSGAILEICFGIFLCLLAVYFWKSRPVHEGHHRLPKTPLLMLWSGGIGGISNILGIGGGTLTVPFLTAFHMPPKQAIGTSAACSLLITTIGAVSYLILGIGQTSLPEDVGYIDLPSFCIIGIVSFFAAPYGAKLTHELSPEKVKKIFAGVLLITGLFMIF